MVEERVTGTVSTEMHVTKNGYGGGSLDCSGSADDPFLLVPNDQSGENG